MQGYQSLRQDLPRFYFKPQVSRIGWLALGLFGGWGLIYLLVSQPMHWSFKLLASLTIGYFWALSGLVGHELLHGSIIRNQRLQNFYGFFCFLPFGISPTFWRYWHNNLHHSHTQKIILDPDAYPTQKIYRHSRYMQWMYPFTPGSGYLRSYLYFFFWFGFNVQVAQFYFRTRNKIYNKLNHKRVLIELALAFSIHGFCLWWTGPSLWFWVYGIPFLMQNYIPFSYISTNHNLSPLTKKNDPLVNSLTVTNWKILEFLHIQFGYHVEHHLFPTMSGRFLKQVHQKLKSDYGEKYQVMKKWDAMKALYSTARIYKSSKVLTNPLTGATYRTLGNSLVTSSHSPNGIESDKPKKMESSIEDLKKDRSVAKSVDGETESISPPPQ